MFKLLILDVDGVLTDGKKTYDINGNVISKTFCDKDFTIIKYFKALGIPVVWLSGDSQVNEVVAKKRNIDFYLSRYLNGEMMEKVGFLDLFEKKYNVNRKEMAYVGDDIFDLPIMREVGFAFCPFDAQLEVKNYIYYSENYSAKWGKVLDSDAGKNVLIDLWKCFLNWGYKSPTYEQILKLDAEEKSSKEMK